MTDETSMFDNHSNPLRSIAAGGLDWLAIWRQMYDAERAQEETIRAAATAERGDRWEGRAQQYAAATSRAAQPDHFLQLVLPHLRPTDTVLDIGAGAGRHAVYLAQHVAQVIAVERSPEMRRHLAQRMEEHNVKNVTIVPTTWPDDEVPPADVAICAHVVYGVRDIGPFLQHMHARTQRGCFILAGFRQPAYVISPFWERIYGAPRLALPGAVECLNVLYQLGIPAQLTTLPASRYTFADEAEALADIRWRLQLPQSPTTDAAIRDAMKDLAEHIGNGQLVPRNQPSHTAMLWWMHEQRP